VVHDGEITINLYLINKEQSVAKINVLQRV